MMDWNRGKRWGWLVPLLSVLLCGEVGAATFEEGPKGFLLDGKPFLIRSGEMHYARVPREYWSHRLRMLRAMGLNTVSTYVFWNFHEPAPGQFNFTGQADVAEYCRLAQAEGLKVIIRPGPYVCAEWDMGGHPWWLLQDTDLRLRTMNSHYLAAVRRYLTALGEQLAPLEIDRGGPIILVQVENEDWGHSRNQQYTQAMKESLLDSGFTVPLFRSEMGWMASRAMGEDLLCAIGSRTSLVRREIENLREAQPGRPLFCSELYTGWYDNWGDEPSGPQPADEVAQAVAWLLKEGVSFNLYMAHGGTSFGFTAGANGPRFRPVTTSYDYGAPISESGEPTPMYHAIRKVIAAHLDASEPQQDIAPPNPVIQVPAFELEAVSPVRAAAAEPVKSLRPLPLETLGLGTGCLLYRTQLPPGTEDRLLVNGVHDFAQVFLNGKRLGTMDRGKDEKWLWLPDREKEGTLEVLLETFGRIHYGRLMHDRKGITGQVRLVGPTRSTELLNWEMVPVPIDAASLRTWKRHPVLDREPALFQGTFAVGTPGDTFLRVIGSERGLLWVNGHALGHYWQLGPQQTLYCPGPWLKPGRNEVLLLDFERTAVPLLQAIAQPKLEELDLEAAGHLHRRPTQSLKLDGMRPIATGTFPRRRGWKEVRFDPTETRYVCLVELDSAKGDSYATCAELRLLDADGREIAPMRCQVAYADSEEVEQEAGYADRVLDGDPDTYWHSRWHPTATPPPHQLVIGMDQPTVVSGLRYLQRLDSDNGEICRFAVHVSLTPFPGM